MAKFIVYLTQTGHKMRAAVRRNHRDGSMTVEPFFWQDAEGKDVGCFQGGAKLRIWPEHVKAAE